MNASHAEGLNGLYSEKRSIMEGRYAIIAMFILQVYELVAGIENEVRLVHRRASWSSVKILYLLCRYYPLGLWFLVMWAYVSDHDAQTCGRVAQAVHTTLAPCLLLSQAVMVMRAYGFSGRNKRILVMLASCYTGLLAIDIWAFCAPVEIPPPLFYAALGGSGCFPNYGGEIMALRIGYSMLAAILMDLISLVVVLVHCFKSGWNQDVSLARYFVNQGLASFAFVSVVNIVNAIIFFRPPRFQTGIGLPLILTLPNVVACRLILQLREQATPTQSQLSRRHSGIVRNALFAPSSDAWTMNSQVN